jgi:prephenate dehydrogenase
VTSAAGAEVIVLATPVDVTLDFIHRHTGLLRSALTIDTGSTKRQIVAAARRAGLNRFVGGHPMAGAASSGPAAARADLFDGRLWFLISRAVAADVMEQALRFVTRLGARPIVLDDDGEEHDRVMAAVSHLPQVVASVLMTVAAEAAGSRLAWAGSGLRDTTRLAESSAAMWESVLATNAAELKPLLLDVAKRLEIAAEQLTDGESIRALFSTANRHRALL